MPQILQRFIKTEYTKHYLIQIQEDDTGKQQKEHWKIVEIKTVTQHTKTYGTQEAMLRRILTAINTNKRKISNQQSIHTI